jgi:hypothetical protein
MTQSTTLAIDRRTKSMIDRYAGRTNRTIGATTDLLIRFALSRPAADIDEFMAQRSRVQTKRERAK